MKKSVFFLLLALSFLFTSCNRSPKAKRNVKVNLALPLNSAQQAVALPGTFTCIAVAVHVASDNDGSHCQASGIGQFSVTNLFGPFQEGNNLVQLTLPAETVTFHLFGFPTTCPSDLASFIGSSDVLSLQASSFNLSSSVNNITLSINNSVGSQVLGCQGVPGV